MNETQQKKRSRSKKSSVSTRNAKKVKQDEKEEVRVRDARIRQLRDCLIALYLNDGTMTKERAQTITGLQSSTLRLNLTAMGKDLREDKQHKEVTRAANRVSGMYKANRAYTNHELKAALRKVELPNKISKYNAENAKREFDIPPRTMYAHGRALRQLEPSIKGKKANWSEELLDAALDKYMKNLPKLGAETVFLPAEEALLVQVQSVESEIAAGRRTNDKRSECKRIANEMGRRLEEKARATNSKLSPQDQRRIKRLKTTKCSRTMQKQMEKRAAKNKLSPKVSNQKESNDSVKRASAENPFVIKSMFQEFDKITQEVTFVFIKIIDNKFIKLTIISYNKLLIIMNHFF